MSIDLQTILHHLQQKLPDLLALYHFGSRSQGQARAGSDLDLAVLVAGYTDPLQLWDLTDELANMVGCEVDLLDMRAASTVMQHQILTTGGRYWCLPSAQLQVELFEAAMLSEKLELDSARAALLRQIEQEGKVYG